MDCPNQEMHIGYKLLLQSPLQKALLYLRSLLVADTTANVWTPSQKVPI
jgi:uncharacterized membrane protein